MPPPPTEHLSPTSPAQQDSITANLSLTPEQTIQRKKKVVCIHSTLFNGIQHDKSKEKAN